MGKKSGQKQQPQPGSNATLDELTAQVQEALTLLDTDAADKIIGPQGPGPEHGVLIKAVSASVTVLWMAMVRSGAKNTPQARDYVAKTLVMLLQIVHFAYAVGIREGMKRAQK